MGDVKFVGGKVEKPIYVHERKSCEVEGGEREGGKEEGWTGILELKGFTVVDLHGQRGRKGETN